MNRQTLYQVKRVNRLTPKLVQTLEPLPHIEVDGLEEDRDLRALSVEKGRVVLNVGHHSNQEALWVEVNLNQARIEIND